MGTVVTVLDSMHVHLFSVSDDEFCKNVILFGDDNISSAHTDNRYLVFVEGPIDELDDTIITVKVKCSANLKDIMKNVYSCFYMLIM